MVKLYHKKKVSRKYSKKKYSKKKYSRKKYSRKKYSRKKYSKKKGYKGKKIMVGGMDNEEEEGVEEEEEEEEAGDVADLRDHSSRAQIIYHLGNHVSPRMSECYGMVRRVNDPHRGVRKIPDSGAFSMQPMTKFFRFLFILIFYIVMSTLS